MVGFVDSLLPILEKASGSVQGSDRAESTGSFIPPLEVFMAEGGPQDVTPVAPIVEQTSEQLEDTRRRLEDEQAALARQREDLTRQCEDHARAQALRSQDVK